MEEFLQSFLPFGGVFVDGDVKEDAAADLRVIIFRAHAAAKGFDHGQEGGELGVCLDDLLVA